MVQKDCLKNKIIIVCGPTATGKTSLAVNLAKALDTEVISADSMLIYKGFDIGTAKPTEEEKRGITHYMIDVADGNADFSVSDYKTLAMPTVKKLLSKGKTPIICGGTGFYINALLYDYSYGGAAANADIRAKYEDFLKNNGNDALFDILKQKDPETAEKLHKNDVKRIIRAIEIAEASGKPKSAYKDDVKPNFDYVAVTYGYEREELYRRIEKRVDLMFEKGLIKEVENLLKSGISPDAQAMQGIGYKETVAYLNGEISREEAIDRIKMNTRRYAKRQITFFKKLPGLKTLTPTDDEKKVLEFL